jgi:hypothetical protein
MLKISFFFTDQNSRLGWSFSGNPTWAAPNAGFSNPAYRATLYHEGRINKTHSKPFVDALLEGDNEGARNALEQKTKNKNKLIAARGKRELSYLNEQCQQPCATKP